MKRHVSLKTLVLALLIYWFIFWLLFLPFILLYSPYLIRDFILEQLLRIYIPFSLFCIPLVIYPWKIALSRYSDKMIVLFILLNVPWLLLITFTMEYSYHVISGGVYAINTLRLIWLAQIVFCTISILCSYLYLFKKLSP